MKAITTALVATVVIAVGAWFVLGELGFSVQDTQSGPNVRLD
ncbi:hypothetical protein JANAI62_17760 [Jannaschia pagri]|uniref:Uncharacterized protein n=1 Tax=Jannaschia pagri TaxID=2829797 RepID=A0ABQ4NL54_9RHOB|nr:MULTISPECIES: hypothetical protein [unclassified Jannaschia]GIT91320.1 hypothetical protein JANAI61_17780 [Jannaschia sp. AI_61]GIT95153.1 hypothetical protein JANAI62_17760 [Jannaschia sp. AI_62]